MSTYSNVPGPFDPAASLARVIEDLERLADGGFVDLRPAPPIPVPPWLLDQLAALELPTYRERCNALERVRYERRRAAHRGSRIDWLGVFGGP